MGPARVEVEKCYGEVFLGKEEWRFFVKSCKRASRRCFLHILLRSQATESRQLKFCACSPQLFVMPVTASKAMARQQAGDLLVRLHFLLGFLLDHVSQRISQKNEIKTTKALTKKLSTLQSIDKIKLLNLFVVATRTFNVPFQKVHITSTSSPFYLFLELLLRLGTVFSKQTTPEAFNLVGRTLGSSMGSLLREALGGGVGWRDWFS